MAMATAIRRKERQCAKARRTQLVQQQSVLSATCEACPFLNYSGADKCLECGVGVKLYNIGRELERVSMQSKARMRQLTKERVEREGLTMWRYFILNATLQDWQIAKVAGVGRNDLAAWRLKNGVGD